MLYQQLISRITNLNNNTHYSLKLSFIEIYNENIKDLIANTKENLIILEDPIKGVTINNLTEKLIEIQKD